MSEPLLVVLNPRRIPEVIKALEALPIRRAWLTGYTESELVAVMADVVKTAAGGDANFGDHDPILVLSDDGRAEPKALTAVLDLLAAGHPVVTGYSRLAQGDDRVNLARSPLRTQTPHPDAYDLWTLPEVKAHPERAVPSFFAGMCLTGMSRDMWERFPFQVFNDPPGAASDFSLSIRLQNAGVPIVAARDGYVEHLKATPWGHGAGGLLIGQIPAEVRYE